MCISALENNFLLTIEYIVQFLVKTDYKEGEFFQLNGGIAYSFLELSISFLIQTINTLFFAQLHSANVWRSKVKAIKKILKVTTAQ